MSRMYKLPLVLQPQPEGGCTVTCPLLPELITEGETAQEALLNANDALAAIVEALQAHIASGTMRPMARSLRCLTGGQRI